tara:strand:+ start:7133 stop:7999 length:867 start_codon:yes stop_codon:yes gene_type:complete
MSKRKALGSGLEALLSDKPRINVVESNAQHETDDQNVQQIPIDKISRNINQPRKVFFDDELKSIADSIRELGQFTPILVRQIDSGYELIAGERRWRAMQSLKYEYIKAIVLKVSDKDSALIAIVENIQREQLNAIEESEAFKKLQVDHSMTHEDISRYTGKSRSHVTNLIRLSDLSDFVKTKLLEGKIDMGHARAVITLKSVTQITMIKTVISRGLSVRALESLIKNKNSTKPTAKTSKPQDTVILERELSEKLCANVNISHNSSGQGKVEIKYSSLQELEGIIKKIR